MLPVTLLGASLVLVPSAASAQPSPPQSPQILPQTAEDPFDLVDQLVKGLVQTSANPDSSAVLQPGLDVSQAPTVGGLPLGG
jgi:hypothetical protein